jgi:ATP-dependent protease ClpP protease subunit
MTYVSVTIFLILGLHTNGLAADFTSFPGPNPGETVIVASGRLMFGDETKFDSQSQNIQRAIVIFQSPGGNLTAGLEIGKIIRAKHYNTLVPSNSLCASACALAWLGGVNRYMSREAKVGFHAAYIEQQGKAQESGMANALVGAYVNSLGLPERAVIYITTASPDTMQWLSPTDSVQFGINASFLNEREAFPSKFAASRSNRGLRQDQECRLIGNTWGISLDGCRVQYIGTSLGFSFSLPLQWKVELQNDTILAADLKTGVRAIRIGAFKWDGRSFRQTKAFDIEGLISVNSTRLAGYPAAVGYAANPATGYNFRVAVIGRCDLLIRLIYAFKNSQGGEDEFAHIINSLSFDSTHCF